MGKCFCGILRICAGGSHVCSRTEAQKNLAKRRFAKLLMHRLVGFILAVNVDIFPFVALQNVRVDFRIGYNPVNAG